MAWTPPYTSQPSMGGLASFTSWWNENLPSMTAEMRSHYQPYLDQLQNIIGYDPTTGAWDASRWPSITNDWNNYQGSIDALTQQIQNGPTASDTAGAMAYTASLYGMTPEEWQAMQDNQQANINPENVQTTAENLAMQDTAFSRDFQKQQRMAQATAAEQVNRQLENIFGERGGLAGFSAAYEMTSQMADQGAQAQSRFALDRVTRAVDAINKQNAYYGDLINRGAIQANDYLKWRFDQLQTANADYMQMQNNLVQKYQADVAGIQAQIDSVVTALNAEMGVDQGILDQLQQAYDLNSSIQTDADAAANAQGEQAAALITTVGTGVMTLGASLIATPFGLPLLIAGGLVWLGGSLASLFPNGTGG